MFFSLMILSLSFAFGQQTENQKFIAKKQIRK